MFFLQIAEVILTLDGCLILMHFINTGGICDKVLVVLMINLGYDHFMNILGYQLPEKYTYCATSG